MKVAVTGASGFIGGHVVAELASRGVEIISMLQHVNDEILTTPETTAVVLEMNDVDDHSFDLLGRPDTLIHLAWGGLPHYRSLHHFETELSLQYRFLSTLVKSGLQSMVVAGTCFEYGMQSGALIETMETQPNNPYGFAKDMLRRELEFLRESHPFSFTWARLFYLYGNGQAPTSLLSQLKLAVDQGEKTFNMSGGEQLRDYLPVTEVANHFVDLAMVKADIGTVNICSGEPISVGQLVQGWIKENAWDIEPNFGHYPYPEYEPMEFWGDCSKLREFAASMHV